MIKTIKDANIELFKRYRGLSIGRSTNVYIMCCHALKNDMLEDKQSRWLGFIQGVLYCEGIIDIDEERNLSRKLFHQAYQSMGINKPSTVNLELDW